MTSSIDTDRFSRRLRGRGIDHSEQRVLLTRLTGSEQEQDLTEPANCDGFGRIRHFRREAPTGWPDNPLPIEPAARALGTPADEPLLRAQVFQNAVCNWRCWYCYVDFPLLSGNPAHSAFLSADEMLDLYLGEPECPAVIDLSGGQPDLVPEWVVWTAQALARRGLEREVYLWSDDNLSNDYFWTKLAPGQRDALESYRGYGKVCCFKGFDETSFAFNTGAAPELWHRQFVLMRRLVEETTLDLYAYVTLTAPAAPDLERAMNAFVDRLQEVAETLPLRTVPLRVMPFTPTRSRMGQAHERALAVQEEAVAAWMLELEQRVTAEQRATAITDVRLRG
jgi:uncharacterized Fe-S cluster-containing radical SAM superfamily protein